MARNGSGVYSLPAGSIVANGETVVASQHNTPLEDLKDDANLVRPVVAGGTGGSTPETARAALGTVLQTEQYDFTAGRVLITGAGGLGGFADNLAVSGNYDTVLPRSVSGFIGHATSDRNPTNSPISNNGACGLHVFSTVDRGFQLLVQTQDASGGAGRMAVRSYDSGWGPWREIFNQGNILGTVSQSAGVPTGRVIERGSNANGEYVRFADGTLICNGIFTFDLTTLDIQAVTLPASFTKAFGASISFDESTVDAVNDGLLHLIFTRITDTSLRIQVRYENSGTSIPAGPLTVDVRYSAHGRWF